MITGVFRVLVLLGSGVTAGVLFAVALSVLPALSVMPADRYVYAHKLIGRYWDPTMPAIVLSSTAVDLALTWLLQPPASWWYAAGAALLLTVSVVSHFANVPINRTVKVLDPDRIPVGWHDPRPLWRRWHRLRTVLALLALAANATAALMI